jgi:hypothetical protein
MALSENFVREGLRGTGRSFERGSEQQQWRLQGACPSDDREGRKQHHEEAEDRETRADACYAEGEMRMRTGRNGHSDAHREGEEEDQQNQCNDAE